MTEEDRLMAIIAQEHERVLLWRVLATDIHTIITEPSDPGELPSKLAAWAGAYRRQLEADHKEGCL